MTLKSRLTIFGAILGFIATRFLEDGNLLITNFVILIFALSARGLFTIAEKVMKTIRA